MLTINKTFLNESEKQSFVLECEEQFESDLDRIANSILEEDGVRFVTLAGPTCSGKTTTAATLIRDLNKAGRRVRLVSIDDFFRDRTELLEEAKAEGRKEPDFETVRAIDFELLSECVEKISRGERVRLPIFDFTLGSRRGYEEFDASMYDVALFEGIQAIYPEVTDLFRHYHTKSIYVSVADDVTVNGVFFSSRMVRFLRRLVRDYFFRASTPEYTFKLWKNVSANEDANILPYADAADIKLDSFLPYELFVIKDYAIPLLREIPDSSEYKAEAAAIIESLLQLETIDSHYVPDSSVFREFIGPKKGKA